MIWKCEGIANSMEPTHVLLWLKVPKVLLFVSYFGIRNDSFLESKKLLLRRQTVSDSYQKFRRLILKILNIKKQKGFLVYSLIPKKIIEPSFLEWFSSFCMEKCFIEALLVVWEFRWSSDNQMDDEVSFCSFSFQRRHSFMFEVNLRSVLCTRFYCYRFLSENGYIDDFLRSENGFSRGEWDFIVKILSFTSESRFAIWNRKSDVEIAVSIFATMTFTAHLDAHAILDSCRNIDSFWDFFFGFSFSMTICTFLRDFLACTMTGATWSRLFHSSENRLHAFANLPTSVTCGTSISFSSLSMTVNASRFTRKLYSAIASADGILERDLHLDLDIFTDIGPTSRLSSSESTTEKRRENIPKVACIESSLESSKSTHSAHSFCTSESVIIGFFLRIRKNRIGFIEFFEFCFFGFVSTVTVRMEFHCLFSVGFFYLIFSSIFRHSE